MLTFEYLRWFHHVAGRQAFTATTRGVFQYILELAVEGESTTIVAKQDAMATVLNISPSTLDRSLEVLRRNGIINTARGKINICPPAPSWIDKYLKRVTWCETERRIWANHGAKGKSPSTSRATRQAVVGDTPPKGVSTPPQGNRPKPPTLPPQQTQAKPLTARRLLEIQRAIGVIPDIRLIRFANEHPDEPYIMEGGEGS